MNLTVKCLDCLTKSAINETDIENKNETTKVNRILHV